MLASLAVNVAISHKEYFTGSLYDLPMLTVFFWYAYAGWVAYKKGDKLDAPLESSHVAEIETAVGDSVWASRMAMAAVLSLPVFALYALWMEHDTQAVREFRLTVTLIASLPLALL